MKMQDFDFEIAPVISVSREEIQGIEFNEYLKGISPYELMKRAAKAFADQILETVEGKKVVFLVSGGNNGGDGIEAFHLLYERIDGCLIQTDPRGMKSTEARQVISEMVEGIGNPRLDERQQNWFTGNSRLKVLGKAENLPKPEMWEELELSNLEELLANAEVIIDALFGLNLRTQVREPFDEIIGLIGSIKTTHPEKVVISLDLPSGLDANTGEWHAPKFKPDLTVTFQYPKHGHLLAGLNPIVVSIGIPEESMVWVNTGLFLSHWPRRNPNSHKGMNGRLLVIGGSDEFTGAPLLSSMAALRAGIDTVRVAIPEKIRDILASQTKDLLLFKLRSDTHSPKHIKVLKDLALKRHDSVVIGMGLSNKPPVYKFVREYFKQIRDQNVQIILDADAIRAFREGTDDLKNSNAIITPHRAEFRYMLKEEIPADFQELITFTENVASRLGITIVLKGSIDIITNGTRTFLNKTGHPGMTVGGTGDVLAGLIGAFTTLIKDTVQAAALACYVMGLSGEKVAEVYGNGLVASDIIPQIAKTILGLEKRREELIYRP
ncbi:MAG: NAD(P)H-hydrate dehydratase [Methanobacteriota archaeon]|nr:MAG: NAD(P)H-hydrate dehydratase [Euryarchaeota archaeon]